MINSKVKFFEIDASYADEICVLDIECFKDDSWSVELICDDMKNSNSIWLASFYENKLIGFVNSVCIADEAEINRIAVKEEYRHLGIGKKLLDLTIEKIKQKKCSCIYLEVRENNINAIGLYKKAFFTVCGMRKNYYKNPTENAALMKLKL